MNVYDHIRYYECELQRHKTAIWYLEKKIEQLEANNE